MVSQKQQKCEGCDARLGEPHFATCKVALCWQTREHCNVCKHCDLQQQQGGQRYPFAGELETVLSLHNAHYFNMDLDEYDFFPRYQRGCLVGLSANRVGPGPWHVIETSSQARHLTDLSFPLPHLSLQTADDCVEALRESPLLPQLCSFQLGDTGRAWSEPMSGENALAECDNVKGLIAAIEGAPRQLAKKKQARLHRDDAGRVRRGCNALTRDLLCRPM
jgi:hypothetical protein